MKPGPVRDLDWEPKRARELGEAALDIWQELLERIRDLPVSRYEGVDAVREAVALEVPEEPMPVEDLVGYLRSVVMDHSMYPGHPGFMAYISGAGTVPGAAADLIAAGGAMACFIGLKLARDRRAGWDVRTEGLLAGPPLRIYASKETHSVNYRAADMMGLGRDAVRSLPVDDGYRLRLDQMRRAIEEDIAAGLRPIAVVGSVGTVATGAVDPLDQIADLAEELDLWFHVDGAYGGPAVLAEELRPLLVGVERADSIAFDPHKWLYTPHSGGCILVRDFEDLPRSFSIAEYSAYVHEDKEATGTGVDGINLSPQFSRSFWALKVWVSLLAHGTNAYGRRIARDVELSKYLHRRADERPDFEPMAPTTLSICCFRYVPEDLPDGPGREEYLDTLNERLMTAIQMDGRVYPSNAVLDGRFVLRSCIVNFRTEADEMDLLLDVAADLGAKLDAELRPAGLTAGRTG